MKATEALSFGGEAGESKEVSQKEGESFLLKGLSYRAKDTGAGESS